MNRAELQAMAQRELARQKAFSCRLLCCASTPCLSSGATAVLETLRETIEIGALRAEVEAVATGCMGRVVGVLWLQSRWRIQKMRSTKRSLPRWPGDRTKARKSCLRHILSQQCTPE